MTGETDRDGSERGPNRGHPSSNLFPGDLPVSFRDRIARTFGVRGTRWLAELPGLLDECVRRWDLQHPTLMDNLSYNALFTAQSPQFGPVVLKLGVETETEIHTIRAFSGGLMCRCWDADVRLGAAVLERIEPGHDLRTVPDSDQRIAIAADLMQRLPEPVSTVSMSGDLARAAIPLYSDWLAKAFVRARREHRLGAAGMEAIAAAEQAYAHVAAEFPGEANVLLHGDLHHENILWSAESGWRTIDPKGVIGVKVIECGRFILNELGMHPMGRLTSEEQERIYGHIITELGRHLGVDPRIAARCALMELVLCLCWQMEDGEPPEDIAETLGWLPLYYQFL